MDRQQILQKIESIHQDLRNDQFRIMAEKIQQTPFHFHRSNRGFFMRKLIHFFRRILKKEVELIMQPVMDHQKDIQSRFLNEIQNLKKYYSQKEIKNKGRGDVEEKNSANSEKPSEPH